MTNIFWFHEDPRIAARMHADMHIPKMAVEAAQCAATAIRRNGYDGDDIYEEYPSPGDATTPQEWCTQSRAHTEAAIDYGIAVLGERNRRWPDRGRHATVNELRRHRDLLEHEAVEWPHEEWVADPPTFGIDEQYTVEPEAAPDQPTYVWSYRIYALAEKDYQDESFTAAREPAWAAPPATSPPAHRG